MKWKAKQSKKKLLPLLVVFGSFLLALTVSACASRPYVRVCDPADPRAPKEGSCVEGGVTISFSQTPDPVDADTLVITREVDPDVLSYSGGGANGMLTLTLTDGTTRSYTTDLVYSSSKSANITPTTPGFQVFAFVPTDPSSLQAFIDQYRTQTTELSVQTMVSLEDVADSSDTATVDVQEAHDGSQSYIGSVGVSVGGSEEMNKDF